MLKRRELLTDGALAIAAMAVGGFASRTGSATEALPSGLITGRDVLAFHQGDTVALDWIHAVRATTPNARIDDQAVAVLASQGFARTGALLHTAHGKTVIALLDDGDAIAFEAMLHRRGGTGLTRRRYRERTLLTASL